jgi:predicted 3-demethylubiquinone-9 3-methyltransferase (glyoxalase superfamily)
VDRNGRLIVTNEFASVEIWIEPHSHSQLAWVTDRKSGVSRRIDPLALEGLVWAPDHVIASLADPGCRK